MTIMLILLISIASLFGVVQPQVCQSPKVYTDCGSACPPTCDQRKDLVCIDLCVSGCFCPTGTVLHEGKCITPTRCPKACLPPMNYSSCGSPCPPTCDDLTPVCAAVCEIGCYCPAGTVNHLGRCISPDECPLGTTTPGSSPKFSSSFWMLLAVTLAVVMWTYL